MALEHWLQALFKGTDATRHSLCTVDFSVSDGADERHNLAVVKKETHEGNRGFLLLSTHLPQNMSCGRRHGLHREDRYAKL